MRGLELINVDLVVLIGTRENFHRGCARELDDLGVGGPVGGREDGLVSGVEQRGEGLENRLLSTVGHQNLVGADLVT